MKVFQVWAQSHGPAILVGTYATNEAAKHALAWLMDHRERFPVYEPGCSDHAKRIALWKAEAHAYAANSWSCEYSIAVVDVLDESQFPTIKETTCSDQ